MAALSRWCGGTVCRRIIVAGASYAFRENKTAEVVAVASFAPDSKNKYYGLGNLRIHGRKSRDVEEEEEREKSQYRSGVFRFARLNQLRRIGPEYRRL